MHFAYFSIPQYLSRHSAWSLRMLHKNFSGVGKEVSEAILQARGKQFASFTLSHIVLEPCQVATPLASPVRFLVPLLDRSVHYPLYPGFILSYPFFIVPISRVEDPYTHCCSSCDTVSRYATFAFVIIFWRCFRQPRHIYKGSWKLLGAIVN